MEFFQIMSMGINAVVNIAKIEFNLFGFDMSIWQLFIYAIVASLVAWFIWRVIG